VLVNAKSIPDQAGAIAGWVGTLADITAEVGAEAAMSDARDKATEASRLKSDFLANMSHEIRTPMNGVIGMTDLLLETELDPRQRDYAQTVRNSGEALLTIVNDILDFSKVEAGKLQIEDIDFDVRAIVGDVVDLLAGAAQTKGLELIEVVERCVPDVIRGDPGRIRQILTNVIGNAIKFTQTGEIVVRVTESVGAGDETIVNFEVTDTGDGIAADKLAVVFQPFVQADTSTSRRYGGTGLGLAICSQLVSLMGGDCGVTSELGTGSTFWFTISAHAVACGERPANQLYAPDDDLTGVRALIVDDNATLCEVLADCMTAWGMSVTTADSDESALTMMRAAERDGAPIAVALLDRTMPGTDALTLERTILDDPDVNARVVLMIGLGDDREVGPEAESGVRASLAKPIHLDALHSSVRVALGLQFPEPIATGMKASSPKAATPPRGGHILLAEDNLINQKVAVAILKTAGFQVDTVLNGTEAVHAATAGAYDAILMDCQMPEMSGYEATAAIRALEPSDRHIPIIAMTAGARREDRERCLAEGMDSYLAKPVSKDALLALLSRSMREHPTGSTMASAHAPAQSGDTT
jgi:CheY-like chemotaxis protein/nitrogen-specific signal transduction histidine kinase